MVLALQTRTAMMKKKSFMLAGVIAAATLAGCGNNDSQDLTTKDGGTTSPSGYADQPLPASWQPDLRDYENRAIFSVRAVPKSLYRILRTFRHESLLT